MNLNELIKKYEKEINELDDIIFVMTLRHESVSKYYKEKNIYEEILSDLKQLKEKIIKRQFTKSYISTNQDNSLMAVESMIKEIIGDE